MTSTACRTNFLRAEPLHHVAGVAAMAAVQAEVGRATDGHVADGALEGEALADSTLSASGLAPTVAAVHTKLCGTETFITLVHYFLHSHNCYHNVYELTDPFVWLRWARNKLQHICPLLLQPPAVQDLSITLLKVIKL